MYPIEKISTKSGEKILHAKVKPFDFSSRSAREISDLIREMKETMRDAQGIGLAANQIGLGEALFVAEVPALDGGVKFYAAFNPKIKKVSAKTSVMEEGCLSMPKMYGEVERNEKIVLSYEDKFGKPQKVKAWGLLARVFQHEMDHLDGKLILDRAKVVKKEVENA